LANGREITCSGAADLCDADCDVQAQSDPAKPNKFNGDSFSFRAGGWPSLLFALSGLGIFKANQGIKLIVPLLGESL
jgi:hypothetical protein